MAYPNQTKMYVNNEFYDKVFLEYDPETETHYLRRVSDGHYLSAHDDCKHVYWTEPNSDIWTWEQVSWDPEKENVLTTAHGTWIYLSDDDDERLWQCYPPEDEEELEADGFARLRKDFEMDYSVDTRPACWVEEEPNKKEEPKKKEEDKKKRELSPKQLGLNLFMRAKKDIVRKENPEGSWGDHKKILGGMWKELSESQQAKWISEASGGCGGGHVGSAAEDDE
jgi:hypothetical protein